MKSPVTVVEALAEMVKTVARQLKLPSPEIALTGGLLTNAVFFRQALLKQLADEVPGFTIASDGVIPVLGAAILAYENSAQAFPGGIFLQNLRSTAARFPKLQSS